MKENNLGVVKYNPEKLNGGEVVPSEDMNSEEANTADLSWRDAMDYAIYSQRFPPRVNTFKQFAFDPNNIGQCIVTEDADFEVIENNSKSFENGKNKGLPYIPASEPPSWEQIKERLRERNPEDYKRLMRGDFSEEKEAVIEFDEKLKRDAASTKKLVEVLAERMEEALREIISRRKEFQDPAEDVITTALGLMTVGEWDKFLKDEINSHWA